MAFMGAMKGMMGPAKSMGGAMGFGGGGAGPSQQSRPTGNMGSMVKNAMNPMQQMRGLGPSSAVPQQKFSGMRGPSRQREQMPMMQAAQQNQPMISSFTPQEQPQEQDMGSQDPNEQARMAAQRMGFMNPNNPHMMQPGGGGMSEKFPGMQRPDNGMAPKMPQTMDRDQWQQKMLGYGIGPSNRFMQGNTPEAGHMQDTRRMMNPYGQ